MSVWCPHSIDYDAGIIAGLVRKSGKSKAGRSVPSYRNKQQLTVSFVRQPN
jgi:hypothetical protein